MYTLEQAAAALDTTPHKVVDMILSGTLPVLDFEIHDGLVRFEFSPAVVATLRPAA